MPTPTTLPAPISTVSSPCCGSNAGTGAASGLITVPASPVWTRRCAGGGAVPTQADIGVSENWRV